MELVHTCLGRWRCGFEKSPVCFWVWFRFEFGKKFAPEPVNKHSELQTTAWCVWTQPNMFHLFVGPLITFLTMAFNLECSYLLYFEVWGEWITVESDPAVDTDTCTPQTGCYLFLVAKGKTHSEWCICTFICILLILTDYCALGGHIQPGKHCRADFRGYSSHCPMHAAEAASS